MHIKNEIPELSEDFLTWCTEHGIQFQDVPEDAAADLAIAVDGPQVYVMISGDAETLAEMWVKRNRFIRLALEDPRRTSGPGETLVGPVGDNHAVTILISYTIVTEKMVGAQDIAGRWSALKSAELQGELQAELQRASSGVVPAQGGFGGFGGGMG